MSVWNGSRRAFGRLVAAGAAVLTARPGEARSGSKPAASTIDEQFFIRPEELPLAALEGPAPRTLSFSRHKEEPQAWRQATREKLAELLGVSSPQPAQVEHKRSIEHEGIGIDAFVMRVDRDLSIPAYLLRPAAGRSRRSAVMAIHGHGKVKGCLGTEDDYHHAFALRLAQAGHLVLCPELRGFDALTDMARSDDGHWLDYWGSRRGRQFTLVTDSFLYGHTLIGRTVEDLLRWEYWLAEAKGIDQLDVAGISYGGDLAALYPVFSNRARRIYTSGSMGSFSAIFSRCYNAPAHCIPGVLQWMDRSDIAGLNAPRPIRLHYGELDTPGPHNSSAAYNETVEPALAELRAIYRAFGAEEQVSMHVSAGRRHEVDNDDLQSFLAGAEPARK